MADEAYAEEYLNQEDYQEQVEEQEAEQEAVEYANIPQKRREENLFTLFQKVWRAPDNSKVGNLDKQELGRLDVNVRDAQFISLLANKMGHSKFGDFFTGVGQITLTTSASKKGWFTELFVSQKKYTTRSSSFGSQGTAQKSKWSLFGDKKDKSTNTHEED